MRRDDFDPEGRRLPMEIDGASSGAAADNIDVAALHGRGALAERRAAYRADPNPRFATFGPKNRREFLALWDARGGVPG